MNNSADFNKSSNEIILKASQSMSYAELSDSFCAHLSQLAKTKQQIKTARWALKSWRESLKFDSAALIKDEFGVEFEVSIKKYADKQIGLGIQKNTYFSLISHIRAIRNFYLKYRKMLSLPPTFAKRLSHLLDAEEYSYRKFWRYHLNSVITYDTLLRWLADQSLPSKQSLPVVKLIERHLAVPAGTLTSTLEQYPPVGESVPNPDRQRFRQMTKDRYGIWTDALQDEYEKLIHFKTAVALSEEMNRRSKSRWSGGDENHPPPSSEMIKSFLRLFFGFCCLSPENPNPLLRGLGIDVKNLSLSMLADIEIVEPYFTVFKLKRLGGVYNNGTITFAGFIASLLREKTGYLYQSSKFCGENPSADSIAQWQEKCLKARGKILRLVTAVKEEKAAGGEQFGFGRDPREPIKNILENPRPLDVTVSMVGRMLANVDKFKKRRLRQAILYRDVLLISMLQANPLRAKMFRSMEIGQHLFKKADNSWWLKFKRHEFKNRHSLKSDYQVQVAPNIWHLIDRYLSEFRPRLSGADKSSRLFLSSVNNTSAGAGLRQDTLGEIVATRTKQYIPNCSGFRIHSFRHITATHIIKTKPEFGFFLAAKVLHDKLSTVEENYAHLKTSEFFEPYNRIFSESWNSLNLPDTKTEDSNSNKSNRDAPENGEASDDEE